MEFLKEVLGKFYVLFRACLVEDVEGYAKILKIFLVDFMPISDELLGTFPFLLCSYEDWSSEVVCGADMNDIVSF
jgi:hypothetical protein